jgi:tricorn protease
MRPPLRRLVPLAVIAALAAAAPAPAATQFLRRPDIAGDQLLFQSEGDLWLASLSTGQASRITTHDGTEGPAFFSPDGRRIAFTAQYDGGRDVYLMDAAGGLPRRLTWDPAGATALGWSADGSEVLFRSTRENGVRRSRFWAVKVTGGAPRLLPIPYGEFIAAHADGRRLAYVPVSAEWQHWKRYRGGEADDIWLADTVAHTFRRLTTDPGVDTEPVWAAGALWFVSERDGHANLWRLDPATGATTQATHYTDFDVRYPGSDGQRIVFEHGDGLALHDPASGETRELAIDLRSDRIHARVRQVAAPGYLAGVALGPTGKRLLVSARGQVLSAPAEHGEVRAVAVQPGARCQYPAWSPDGRQFAFVSDASGEEQVWLAPVAGGAPRQLTRDHHGPLGPLVWSPDGKWIATSDREMRLLLADATSGAFTLVDQADRAGSYDVVRDGYRFSPDGHWLAFARTEPNWNSAIYLVELATARRTRISSPEMHSVAPAFDREGKYLCFLSDRAFDPRYVNANRFFSYDKFTKVSLVTLAADARSPFLEISDEEGAGTGADEAGHGGKPAAKADTTRSRPLPVTRVDVAGIADRVTDVPVPADHYLAVEPAGGRMLLLVQGDPGEDESPSDCRQIRALDLKKKEVAVVAKKATSFQLSGDGKKLLVRSGRSFSVVDADAATLDDAKGKVPTDAWTLTIDPAAEWRQILHETWRIARDFFYDPNMHGVDWAAVGRKYEAMLPAIADRSDLTFVQGEIVAELNCGHAYVRGGDAPAVPPRSPGFLGVDVAFVPGPTPAWRITRLYPGDGFELDAGSPLLAPGLGVKPGDCVLAVNGRPARADEDFAAMLLGTAGQVARVTLNSRPALAGARDVLVKPLASERAARTQDWIASRAEYVRTHGGENFGYVWIPSMGEPGLREWAKHYYPQLGKDALVVDVRFNGGGYIDAMLLLQLATRPYSWFKPRYGASWTRQDWGFAGHLAALCNENSGSDAEEFSDAFQRLGLGPVIGVQTWGGEVGSGDGYAMVDGGLVYIPNYGEWVPSGEWVIEGAGAKPDIVVEDDPAALQAGRDPQLDRAIEELKRKLAATPIRRPAPPPFPDKSRPR